MEVENIKNAQKRTRYTTLEKESCDTNPKFFHSTVSVPKLKTMIHYEGLGVKDKVVEMMEWPTYTTLNFKVKSWANDFKILRLSGSNPDQIYFFVFVSIKMNYLYYKYVPNVFHTPKFKQGKGLKGRRLIITHDVCKTN